VHRAAPRAFLLLLLAPWASAATSVDDQDLSASIRQLDTGDWSARMRTVHELEYLQEDAIPALSVAAVDGDWQVRMAAVHALAFLGPKATPVMMSVLKHEPCPVVRLITLHNLGSQAADGAEEQAMGWIFSASNADVNNCVDQAGPGRAPWASKIVARAPPPAAPARPAVRPREKTEPEPAVASDDTPLTPDIPKPTPPAAPPPPKAADEAPQKSARYAQLDLLLADSSGPPGPKEKLLGVPPLPERPDSATAAPRAAEAPSRPETKDSLSAPRPTGTPETLPHPVVTLPAPEPNDQSAATFEDADGKVPMAPHDSLPDLLLALQSPDAKTRSRAADQLGSSGAAASPAVPALVAALRDKSPRVRASASLALGDIGASDRGVVPLLVKALKDKNIDVRYAAALALSRIKTPEARAAFERHIDEAARRAIERRQQ
jgi:hypothetical protein